MCCWGLPQHTASPPGSPPAPADASDEGRAPRARPRIGVDCWARAFVYHAAHRYPARLDNMLLYLTRQLLRYTPVRRRTGVGGALRVALCLFDHMQV
jgi:hypothetical protein